MFFWNSFEFSMIPQMLAIWSLVPLPFLNPACTSGTSQFTYCWSLAWKILSITLLACEISVIVWWVEHFGIALLWKWYENWPFPVLWPLLSFPNLQAYWVQPFHSITFSLFTAPQYFTFRIWNTSAGIPSLPLALFIEMLPKIYLTSHSKMSGSRWVIMSSCLSGSLRPFW